jgi:CRP/FNR family cyclic AMP-dependent transcriptional regulator
MTQPPPVRRGFYGGLTAESQRKLLRLGRTGSYHPGQVIYSQDAPSAHVRVILEGSVKLTATSLGARETLLEIRTRGDLLGEREVLYSTGPPEFWNGSCGSAGHRPSLPRNSKLNGATATATALGPTQALIITGDNFARFMTSQPDAMAAMARDLEERLSDAQLRLRGITSENANRRLARALLSLSMSTSLPGVERTWLQLTQAELASWIGVSRETVERILRDWRTRGIIETGYRRIVVLQLDNLMRIGGAGSVSRPAVAASLRGFRQS